MPAFTIITITWNNLAGLRKTAASIQAQSCRDFEWLIIDGASTDGTVEAASQGDFAPGIFFSEPDKGLYDAMNKGIDRATGDYLIFMNGGDGFADDRVLEDIARHAAFGEAALIYGDAYEVEGKDRVYKPAFSHRSIVYTMFAHHQSIFYRRADIGTLRYDLSYRIGADWVFTGAILRAGGQAERVRRAICDFERGGLSQSYTPEVQRQARAERKRALKEVFGVREPIVSLLIASKAAVVAVRGLFPGLYDLLRMRRS